MKDVSSKKNMKLDFEILNTIKPLPVSETLYGTILNKIGDIHMISMSRVKAVAAVFICLISIEAVVITSNNNSDRQASSPSIISQPNNMLYYD